MVTSLKTIKSKFDAIEYFEFMKDVYGKIRGDELIHNKEQVNLCGTFFHDDYAYTTDGNIVGRIRVNDNVPVTQPMFWSYNESDSLGLRFMLNYKGYCTPSEEATNLFSENFTNNLHSFFNKSFSTSVFIRRQDMLNELDELYGKRDATKIKTHVKLSVDSKYQLVMDFVPVKATPKNKPARREIGLFINPVNRGNLIARSGDYCSVNVFYLHSILKNTMSEYDIIGIKFNNDLSPVVLYARNNNASIVHWAISQNK